MALFFLLCYNPLGKEYPLIVTTYRIFYLMLHTCLHEVSGKRDMLPRFIMEDAVKPPIFGSYSYDPVKQVFELEQILKNETEHVQHGNKTFFSTKEPPFNRNRQIAPHSRIFRKHVSVSTVAGKSVSHSNLLKWWTKNKLFLKNATTS